VSEEIHCTPGALAGLIKRDLERRQKAIVEGINRTAKDAVAPIREAAPKAFGDLRNSVHAVPGELPKTVVDAPHAGAVEQGSLPHTPDFERLVAWVKLRGMQALNRNGSRRSRFAKRDGPTTPTQARRVGKMFEALQINGSTPVDAPEAIARAISKAIEKRGTPPHWYVRNSLPEISRILDTRIRKALKK
jgi:hypothetical protein